MGIGNTDVKTKKVTECVYTLSHPETTVTSARIPEDACYRARNLCVFSRVQKGTPRLTHKGWVLQRVFLDATSDVTVVLGMRQSISNTSMSCVTMKY